MSERDTLEMFVYAQLGPLRPALRYWTGAFNLDMCMVASILIVERQQYHLPDALRAIRRAGHTFFDLCRMIRFPGHDTTKSPWTNLPDWLNCSRGFCRIKLDTAIEAWHRHRGRPDPLITEMDLCHHDVDASLSVAVSCMILDELARQWETEVPNIRHSVSILSTLYNVSNFHNKKPHSAPSVGGSILDVVVDGVPFGGEYFGERVVRVYNSTTMQRWMKEESWPELI